MEKQLEVLRDEMTHGRATRAELRSQIAQLSLLAEVYRQTDFLGPHYPGLSSSPEAARLPLTRRFVDSERGVDFEFLIANLEGLDWYPSHLLEISEECRELLDLCEPGDRIVELGSHHGFMGTMLASTHPDVFVVGVECHPFCAKIAQVQGLLNRFERRYTVLNAVGSDREGEEKEIVLSAGAGLVETDGRGIVVPTVTGDSILDRLGEVSFLKVDVEGFEGQVLRGCRRILESRPKIALELHFDQIAGYGSSVEEIFRLVGIEGYEGTMLVRGPEVVSAEQRALRVFQPEQLPRSGVANLFLRPCQETPQEPWSPPFESLGPLSVGS